MQCIFAIMHLWHLSIASVLTRTTKHAVSAQNRIAHNYLPLTRHVHEPRNLTTVDDAVSICSCRVDTHTHTHMPCVVPGAAAVASLQMAGAAHTLPVVVQYVLYNSREQQAPSLCTEKQHTTSSFSHSGS